MPLAPMSGRIRANYRLQKRKSPIFKPLRFADVPGCGTRALFYARGLYVLRFAGAQAVVCAYLFGAY